MSRRFAALVVVTCCLWSGAAPTAAAAVRDDATYVQAEPTFQFAPDVGGVPVTELPPLPTGDAVTGEHHETEESDDSGTGVQTAALALAAIVLLAGGAGLAVVMRRGRAPEHAESHR